MSPEIVKDDVVNFAEAAAELGTPPMSASQVVASALEAAGNFSMPGRTAQRAAPQLQVG